MRRLWSFCALVFIAGLIAPAPASAQQSFNVFVGGFTPRSLDGRGTDDVLFQNGTFLSTFNRDNGIDISEFNGATIGGEYLVGLGRNFEAGLGVSFYQRTVPTSYTKLVNTDGTEIEQDLKLRIIPFTATVRWVPLGTDSPIQPYLGAGVGIYAWRYSETGQFVDTNGNVFVGNFVGSGGATGPVVLGGVRFPIGAANVGGEIRWQGGSADLPASQSFAGSKIDLGGVNYLLTIGFRF